MTAGPMIADADEREWESWPPEQRAERGDIEWKTLIGDGATRSRTLTLGVARLPPGGVLRRHRHAQDEVYLVIEGTGVVTVDGRPRAVGAGAGVFLPGDCPHSLEATGDEGLRFAYVLAADSFEDIEYDFGA